jgi:hypothetical protein
LKTKSVVDLNIGRVTFTNLKVPNIDLTDRRLDPKVKSDREWLEIHKSETEGLWKSIKAVET